MRLSKVTGRDRTRAGRWAAQLWSGVPGLLSSLPAALGLEDLQSELDCRLLAWRHSQHSALTRASSHPRTHSLTCSPVPQVCREHPLCAQLWVCNAPGLVMDRHVDHGQGQGLGASESPGDRDPQRGGAWDPP